MLKNGIFEYTVIGRKNTSAIKFFLKKFFQQFRISLLLKIY